MGSCFNAFSRVDVRVDVKIPGGVNAFVVDLRGERYVASSISLSLPHPLFSTHDSHLKTDTKQLPKYGKKPTYLLFSVLSSTLTIRTIGWMPTEDWIPLQLPSQRCGSFKLRKLYFRKVSNVSRFFLASETSPTVTASFTTAPTYLDANATCGFICSIIGWQVGSDPEIQVATVVSNHLTNAVMKYFGDSGRYQHAANLFEKLMVREPEVSSLLAKSYIGMSASELFYLCDST